MEDKFSTIYSQAKQFKRKYPLSVAWRIKSHSKVVAKHLSEDEEVKYTFCAQANDTSWNFIDTCVVCLTNKRIIIGQKRLIFGYNMTTVTPDMFNDLEVVKKIIWGQVNIDTVKEVMKFSNIQPSALSEIETSVTSYMLEEKKKFGNSKSGGNV